MVLRINSIAVDGARLLYYFIKVVRRRRRSIGRCALDARLVCRVRRAASYSIMLRQMRIDRVIRFATESSARGLEIVVGPERAMHERLILILRYILRIGSIRRRHRSFVARAKAPFFEHLTQLTCSYLRSPTYRTAAARSRCTVDRSANCSRPPVVCPPAVV